MTATLSGVDVEVSAAGLGCNNFGMLIDADATAAVVHAALDAGITFFDTARSYGGGESERFLGRALGSRRDEVIVATKFGGTEAGEGVGGSPDYVRRAIDASLEALGTDHVDLYQLHVPDPDVPIAETLGALDELVTAGKVRAVGHSNLGSAAVAEADEAARSRGGARFETAQVEWNLLERRVERAVVPACREHGLGVLPYFPLASGLLTGKYRRGEDFGDDTRLGRMDFFAAVATDENFDAVEALAGWAADHDRTLVDLALGWLASHDVTLSVIAGATRPDQVRANAAACARPLSPEQMAEIDEVLAG